MNYTRNTILVVFNKKIIDLKKQISTINIGNKQKQLSVRVGCIRFKEMDYLQNQFIKCKTHSYNDVIYIQVNEIQENKSIFYCEECTDKDYDFKPQNCIRLKQLMASQNDQVIYNWPPLNGQTLQMKLNDIATQEIYFTQNQIITFFDDLRVQILTKLDESLKGALKQVEKVPHLDKQILFKYKELSQINRFQEILSETRNDFFEAQNQCKNFIYNFHKQKALNTQIFQHLLDEKDKVISEIDLDSLEGVKKIILKTIEEIQIFKDKKTIMNSSFIQKVGDNQAYHNHFLCNIFLKNNEDKENDINNLIIPSYRGVNLIPKLEFMQTNYQPQHPLIIIKNIEQNQIRFQQLQKHSSGNYVSKIILNPYKQYTFQFNCIKYQKNTNESIFLIGLIRDEVKDKQCGFQDLLYYKLLMNKTIELDNAKNILKFVKGHFNNIPCNTSFQLMINQSEGLFSLTDLPYQNNQCILSDNYKTNLKTIKNLRLFIVISEEMELIITQAIEL